MKTIRIPTYTGNDKEMVSTSWYLLPSEEIDLSNTIFDNEDDENNLTHYIFPMVTVFNIAYIYVEVTFSDGSKVNYNPKAVDFITLYSLHDIVSISQINKPKIISIENTLPSGGTLDIVTDPISPNEHKLHANIVTIENRRGVSIFAGKYTEQAFSVLIEDLDGYVPNEALTLILVRASEENKLSEPTELKVPANGGIVSVTSRTTNIDPSTIYTITLSDPSVGVVTTEVLRGDRVIETYGGLEIFGNSLLFKSDTVYSIRIKCVKDSAVFVLEFDLTTIDSREPHPIAEDYIFLGEGIEEQLQMVISNTYTEELTSGKLLQYMDGKEFIYRRYSSSYYNSNNILLDIDDLNDVYQRSISDSLISIQYTNSESERKIAVCSVSVIGEIESIIVDTVLPTNSSKFPLVTANTETEDEVLIYTLVLEDGNVFVKELINNNILVEVAEVYNVFNTYITDISSQRGVIFGDKRAIHTIDFNTGILDNEANVPEEYRTKSFIPSRLLNGNPCYFEIGSNILLEYEMSTSEILEHQLSEVVDSITRYRYGGFSIGYKNEDNVSFIKRIF